MTISIQELTKQFSGIIYIPDSSGYDEARLPFQRHVDPRPAIVAEPVSVADIQLAIDYAKESNLTIAIQSTGHGIIQPCDGGLLLNVRKMNGVTINPDTKTARVEAGATCSDVIHKADEHSLSPITGTSAGVGVAGFSLGGGLGWLSRQYGFAADSIVEVELVTANDGLIVVNEETNPKLLWALRGGSGNFGVVAALTFRLHPAADVYTGMGFYDVTKAAKVLKAFRDWTPSLPDAFTAMLLHFQLPMSDRIPETIRGKKVLGLEIVYNGPAAEAETLLAPLYDKIGVPEGGIFSTTRYSSFIESSPRPRPSAHISAVGLRDALSDELIESLATSMQLPGTFTPFIEIRQWGGILSQSNTSRLLNYNATRFSVYATISTEGLSKDDHAHFTQLSNAIQNNAQTRGFLNFLGDPTKTQTAFDPVDYQHLVELKTTYDPKNIFRFNHNIQPKQ